MTYRVQWEMDIDADTPQEAAQKAFEYVNLPGTTANVFDVYDESGEVLRVDLMEDDCDCNERSCYGSVHDTACALAGKQREDLS